LVMEGITAFIHCQRILFNIERYSELSMAVLLTNNMRQKSDSIAIAL
jgi:hypothetical protein